MNPADILKFIQGLHGCCPVSCHMTIEPDIDPERVHIRWTWGQVSKRGYSERFKLRDQMASEDRWKRTLEVIAASMKHDIEAHPEIWR